MAHRFLHGAVLGLMFFLAGTAYCSCDSYDPDPYDDVPPLVTIEFNYVVPGQLQVRPQVQTGTGFILHALNNARQLPSLSMTGLRASQVDSSFRQAPPQWAIPLRR
jgi:hypothetical protein